MKSKKELHKLVENGQISKAVEHSIEYANSCGDLTTLNELSSIKSELRRHQENRLDNKILFPEFSRNHTNLISSLRDQIEALPYEPNASALKHRVKEGTFKWTVFYAFLITKLIILSWAVFLWRTEGFKQEEAFSLFSALLPGMIINITIMFRNLFQISREGASVRKYIPKQFRVLIWVVFIIYLIIQFFLTTQKVKGNLTFELAVIAFTAVETGLGQFMSELVEKLYKTKE